MTVEVPRHVRIGEITIGNDLPLVFIVGPNTLESRTHALEMSAALAEIAHRLGISLLYKTSFDKANRTSVSGARGVGMREALPILAELRERTGLPVLTDVHEPLQCAPVAEVVDVLQIPAFLCRQTDLLVEAGRTGKIVNIKKGQFVSPQDIRHAAEKVASTGNSKILLTERGATFGYNNLVVDMRGLKIMRDAGWPVVFDATHSVQLPGGAGSASAGQPEFIEPLARAAVAVGVNGIFVETHDAPEKALSDGPNALRLDLLKGFWTRLNAIETALRV